MLAIKVIATPDAIKIEGVIPLETAPFQGALATTEPKHDETNIPMFVRRFSLNRKSKRY